MKIDLSQATFIIPIRIESSDRLRNVITITAFLVENFDTNIIVKEVDSKSVFQEQAMPILEEIVEGDIWKNFNFIFERSDKPLFDIGPKEDNFFFLKPFFGIEYTNDSASYFLTGIYFEDNLGELFEGKNNKFFFTPSFGAGIYNDGSGKKLGNDLQFRTSLEISYELKNKNRIGISLSHISNANLGNKNPGVEILSFSYHIPY